MSATNAPTLRKIGGSLKGKRRSKRKHEYLKRSVQIQIGETKKKIVRGLGGNRKAKPIKLSEANMFDPKEKKFYKVKLLRVLENTADRSFARRNIITKGAIVETDQGKARVVNRPGQDGQVTLIKEA